MDIDALESRLAGQCRGRLVHFGGCRTVALPARRIRQFLRVTKAVAVSGFREEVDWTESTLFEMSYFVALQHHPLTMPGIREVRLHMRRHHRQAADDLGFVITTAR